MFESLSGAGWLSSDTLSLAAIPLISAFIGWLTNCVAVKMLFRPHRPVRILGMTIQGLVPRRQRELAEKIGETVEQNLLSHKDIERVLQSEDTRKEVQTLVEEQIDRFLERNVASIPMIGMLVQGPVLRELRGVLVRQFEDAVPEVLDRLMTRMESHLDFRAIVREKIEEFDLGRLEKIIYDISARELRAIEYLGGVLGFVIGLVQVALVVL